MTLCARGGRCGWAAGGSRWGVQGAKGRFADRSDWVMACQTQGESGQVPGMETHWELLNTEKPSWAQEVPELQVVRDQERVLNERPRVPALFFYPLQGVCFWPLLQHAGLDGVSYSRCSSEKKKKYCRNRVRPGELWMLPKYIHGFLLT